MADSKPKTVIPIDFLKQVNFMEQYHHPLKEYIKNCFAQCTNEVQKENVSYNLLHLIQEKTGSPGLTSVDWVLTPLVDFRKKETLASVSKQSKGAFLGHNNSKYQNRDSHQQKGWSAQKDKSSNQRNHPQKHQNEQNPPSQAKNHNQQHQNQFYGNHPPTYNQPPTNYDFPSGSFNSPYGQSPSAYDQHAAYNQPPPPLSQGQPSAPYTQPPPPAYGQPPPTYTQPPAATYTQPPAAYAQPPLEYAQPQGYGYPGAYGAPPNYNQTGGYAQHQVYNQAPAYPQQPLLYIQQAGYAPQYSQPFPYQTGYPPAYPEYTIPPGQAQFTQQPSTSDKNTNQPHYDDILSGIPITPPSRPVTIPPMKSLADTPPVVGISTDLEKPYLRITTEAEPATIRPLEVLKASLEHCLHKFTETNDYVYLSEQLRSIRQDITVQRIEGPFVLHVHELHARYALLFSDWENFTQVQPRLDACYAAGEGKTEDIIEMSSYKILYQVSRGDMTGLSEFLPKLKPEILNSPEVKFAIRAWRTMKECDIIKYCRMMEETDQCRKNIMLLGAEALRSKAYTAITSSIRDTSLSLFREILGFKDVKDTRDWLLEHNLVCPIEE